MCKTKIVNNVEGFVILIKSVFFLNPCSYDWFITVALRVQRFATPFSKDNNVTTPQ